MTDPTKPEASIAPASPLPWHVEIVAAKSIDGNQIDKLTRFCIGTAAEPTDFPVDRYGIWDEEDAEYIVAACNAYPDLQAQADALAEALEQARVDIWNWSEAEIQRAMLMGGHIAKVAVEQVKTRRDVQIADIKFALTNYRKFREGK